MPTSSRKIYSELITLLVFFQLYGYSPVNGLPEGCHADNSNKVIDCRKLGLTTIPSDVFTTKYEQIKLANNPFECDCNITWFLHGIQVDEKQKKIEDLNSLKCNSPKNLTSKLIKNLKNTDVCSSNTDDPCKGNILINHCDPTREICVRKGMSYECRCKGGFKRKSATTECEVYNACQHTEVCSLHAQCINEIGTYKCVCKIGYVGDGNHCEDKDECGDMSHDCHKDAVCVNKEDGYKCHCKPGYLQLKEGRLCVKKSSIPTKTYVLAGFVAGCPLLMAVILIIFLAKRKKDRRRRLAGEALLFDDRVGDLNEIPGAFYADNQQILGMESFFEDEPITKPGIRPSDSVWSEWEDYDYTRRDSDASSDNY